MHDLHRLGMMEGSVLFVYFYIAQQCEKVCLYSLAKHDCKSKCQMCELKASRYDYTTELKINLFFFMADGV